LPESKMLELVAKGDFDGWLIGDDAITRTVNREIVAAPPGGSASMASVSTRWTSKPHRIEDPVTFCPGVNHTTVAEHTSASCSHVTGTSSSNATTSKPALETAHRPRTAR